MNLLESDPRYLLFAIPEGMIKDGLKAEDVVELMFMKSAELGVQGDYFMIPPDRAELYEQAALMAKQLCERRGHDCEQVSQTVIRVWQAGECADYHLRVVFAGDEQKDVQVTAH